MVVYFNFLLGMWTRNAVTEEQLEILTEKGYITEEEKETILATPQNK